MSNFTFQGFEPSNTTPVPDILFDELLPYLNEAQLKVLLYVIRRTLGFKKSADAISLKQFRYGIITKEERRLDGGCGLKNFTTISKALQSLEQMQCIESEKRKTADGDQATTVYRIRFRGTTPTVVPTTPTVVGVLRETEDGTTRNGGRVLRETYPQETVIQLDSNQETVIQESTYSADLLSQDQHASSSLSLQEMIALLAENGYTIFPSKNAPGMNGTENNAKETCASDTESHSHSQDAHPLSTHPTVVGEIGTPLAASRVTMTPPTESVAITPRSQGEISPDHDRIGDTIQRSHYIATQDISFLPSEQSENGSVLSNPANDTQTSGFASPSQNEASQPDASEQAASYSQDIQPPLAAEKPAVPQLPSAEMKWCAEKLVQITEAKRIARGKVGVYFDEDIRGNSAKSQRQRQLEAAKRILAKGVTEEEYIKAYDERNDEWWNQTQGSLTVEEMAANTKNRVMRILEILEKLETMSKAIGLKQAGQGQKWNATQQRTERAAQENAHSAAMNGGLTYSEINRLKPAEKKAYLEKLKEQQQQKNLAAAQ